jgi:tellurite resistance protein
MAAMFDKPLFEPGEAQEVARVLAAVAAADGAILAREESFLDEFAMVHSVAGHAFIATPLDVERLSRAIRDADKRRQVLRLCLRMALSDGNYAEAEVRAIEKVAAAFGVGADELAQLTETARQP